MTDAIRHADARSALARLECWRATRDKLGECPYGSPATFAADVLSLLSTVEQMREALEPFAVGGPAELLAEEDFSVMLRAALEETGNV